MQQNKKGLNFFQCQEQSQNKGYNESKRKMGTYSLFLLTLKAMKFEPLYSNNNIFYCKKIWMKYIQKSFPELSIVQ